VTRNLPAPSSAKRPRIRTATRSRCNFIWPLSALSAEDAGDGTLADKLFSDLPGLAFALRALATLQSLLAIVLAFLFALAVRRRFQIS